MRKDVKAGLVLSLVVVAFAGWYYTRGTDEQTTIPLASSETLAPPSAPASEAVATPAPRRSAQATPQPRARVRPSATAQRTPKPRVGARTEPVVTRPPADSPPAGPVERPSVASESSTPEGPMALQATRSAEPTRSDGQVAAPPMTPPATVAEGVREAIDLYRVQPGDTFEILAEVYYGNRGLADFLRDSNPQLATARQLPVGAIVKLPALPPEVRTTSPVAESKPESPSTASAARTYTVERGDSFYVIASRLLGSGTRWNEIFELNRALVNDDPHHGLKPGMVLTIPPK